MAFGDTSRVFTNNAAMAALNALNRINENMSQHQLRLATGKRINSAEDDPAGYVLATKLGARARGLNQALANVGDAKSLLSVAEGGLNEINSILETMKEKVTQAASDTLGSDERTAIQNQLTDLAAEIDDIVSETVWNGVALIDGTYTDQVFQTGETSSDSLTVSVSQDHDSTALSVDSLVVTGSSSAQSSLDDVDAAIDTVSQSIGDIGALQLRLATKESTLSIAATNTTAAQSRIEDADIALEQLHATKYAILQQTSIAMLAQANVAPQALLGFLP